MLRAPSPISPENLPHVWRAPELARAVDRVLATGHAALDAQLPGGGWPCGTLVEVLQASPGRHAWQLLLPALARATQAEGGPVVLVDPPHLPFGPALAAQGLATERLLKVQARNAQAALWASEQALRCADVVALLAWLPRCRAADLRRLHLAAAQQGKLLFVFRTLAARDESSPARVRLEVEEGEELRVHLLKRRGPPLASAIELPAQPARLQQLLASRKRGRTATTNRDRSHVLDRTVAIA
ncbi:translesion DNA synthesis-associated protein ImuA [Ramlibacter sp. PS4R-6]|uniref:translesion DNA synthesis-associated protein ImuA n=1 Tax=Ramlibacter sp. PS4R-6 TaxID=3133438 RepID=UPI0030B45D31